MALHSSSVNAGCVCAPTSHGFGRHGIDYHEDFALLEHFRGELVAVGRDHVAVVGDQTSKRFVPAARFVEVMVGFIDQDPGMRLRVRGV